MNVNEITQTRGYNIFIFASNSEALAPQLSVVNVASDESNEKNGSFLRGITTIVDYGEDIIISHIRDR